MRYEVVNEWGTPEIVEAPGEKGCFSEWSRESVDCVGCETRRVCWLVRGFLLGFTGGETLGES